MSFLSHALGLSPIFIDLSFQAQLGVHFRSLLNVGHSCQDYIYSLGTLYGVNQPFAIWLITSVLTYNFIT